MLSALEDRAVFTAAGRDYTWGDVVLAARLWGDWAAVESRARRELSLLALADEEDDLGVAEEEVQAAANEFRYDRDLVSAEEMEQWLERWALDSETWMEWICADLLLKARPDAQPSDAGGPELDDAVHAESVCSGALGRLAVRLAGRAAVHEKVGAGAPLPADGAALVAGLEASYTRLRQEVVTPEALEQRVRRHQADWTQVTSLALPFASEGAAREALMTMREDGLTLEEVAEEARTRVERRQLLLEEIDEAYRHHLLAARAGDLVGPLRGVGRESEVYTLFLVEEKVFPSPADPRIARRAEESLLSGVVSRERDDRVRWRWRL